MSRASTNEMNSSSQAGLESFGRFSDPAFLVLTSLSGGEKHGYALAKDIEDFSSTRLGPGTLYGVLARLEQRGLIEALPADDRRHPYRITGRGAEVLGAYASRLQHVAAVSNARLKLLGA
jgi:DNA-binding PadR family transcriptional regulator